MAGRKKLQISPEVHGKLKALTSTYLEQEIQALEALFDQPPPDPWDGDYLKKSKFRDSAIAQALTKIKQHAAFASGAFHPAGNNDQDDVDGLQAIMDKVNERLTRDGQDG
ncbi:hypothetical protein [Pacificispira sp.]|uniref:hypothetical protein n=1 Tax=Pacificispira sp. TaxID=2888761 RepID=UPI003BAC08BE